MPSFDEFSYKSGCRVVGIRFFAAKIHKLRQNTRFFSRSVRICQKYMAKFGISLLR
jgi:hypothetical protein